MENDNVKFKNNKRVAIILVNYKDYAEKYLADCLAGLKKQDYAGEIKIFITDNESTAESYGCVKKMVEAAENNLDSRLRGNDKKEIGAAQARLMLWPEKEKINSLGNITHFLGFGYTDGYGDEYKSPPLPLLKGVEICYPSGAAVLLTKEALKKVGLFDEEFWMYNEDQDLG